MDAEYIDRPAARVIEDIIANGEGLPFDTTERIPLSLVVLLRRGLIEGSFTLTHTGRAAYAAWLEANPTPPPGGSQ